MKMTLVLAIIWSISRKIGYSARYVEISPPENLFTRDSGGDFLVTVPKYACTNFHMKYLVPGPMYAIVNCVQDIHIIVNCGMLITTSPNWGGNQKCIMYPMIRQLKLVK